jgi:hypothetical protein
MALEFHELSVSCMSHVSFDMSQYDCTYDAFEIDKMLLVPVGAMFIRRLIGTGSRPQRLYGLIERFSEGSTS